MPDIHLHIELLDTDPPVWRRVLVPEKINLHRLHEVIQAGFRRGGRKASERRSAPASVTGQLDRERSLKAQGIHSIEELRQALQAERDRNRK